MGVIGSADGPTSIIVSSEPTDMSMLGILAIAAVAVIIVVIALVAWALTRHGKE